MDVVHRRAMFNAELGVRVITLHKMINNDCQNQNDEFSVIVDA